MTNEDENIYTSSDYTYTFRYTIDSEEITITSFSTSKGFKGTIIIPAEIDGKKVVAVGEGALASGSTYATMFQADEISQLLTSVIIEEGIERIEDGAFASQTSLTEIIIPTSMKTIGNAVFSNCTNLTEIIIPASVEAIGSVAFVNCTNLTNIMIQNEKDVIAEAPWGASEDSITYINDVSTIEEEIIEEDENIEDENTEDENIYTTAYGYSLYYDIDFDSDEITITGFASTDAFKGAIDIPEEIDGKEVVAIGEEAFSDCASITSVVISESITSIEDSAFRGCSGLRAITIPNTVTSLGDSVFVDCTSLTSVSISNGITRLGDSVFAGCTSLTTITIPNNVTSLGDFVFSGCGKLTIVTMPDIVTDLGHSTFLNCTSLKVIKIPEGVTSIGESDFYNCTSLESIELPDTITSIEDFAFYNCTSLKTIEIPSSVESIGESAFAGCTSLRTATITEGVMNIEASAFSNCTSLTILEIPSSVESIGESAFSGCIGLKTLTITEGVGSIEKSAFSNCTSLAELEIPSSVESIGESAFAGCIGLKTLTITERVGSIEKSAFSNCTSLAELEIPSSVEVVGELAFAGCTGLTTIIIKEGVRSIEKSAFSNCTSLTDVEISSTVENIGASAFFSCSSLKTITIPEGVVNIGASAFSNCSSLIEILFSDTVESLGEYIFSGCRSLKEIEIPNSVISIGESAFYSCSALELITIDHIEGVIAGTPWGADLDITEIIYLQVEEEIPEPEVDETAPDEPVIQVGDYFDTQIIELAISELEDWETPEAVVTDNKDQDMIATIAYYIMEAEAEEEEEEVLNEVSFAQAKAHLETADNMIKIVYTAIDTDENITTFTLNFVSRDKATQEPLVLVAQKGMLTGETQTLTTTGGSGEGAITYGILSGEAILTDDILTVPQIGVIYVVAYKASDDTYIATQSEAFKIIINASDFSDEITISTIENQIYIGSAIKPTPIVTLDDVILEQDIDYTLSYNNNTDVGTASVTITGMGNYIGSKTVSFEIEHAIPEGDATYNTFTITGKKLSDTNLSHTFVDATDTKLAGSIIWVDKDGNEMDEETSIIRKDIYEWIFTPTNTNYTMMSGTVVLYEMHSANDLYYLPTEMHASSNEIDTTDTFHLISKTIIGTLNANDHLSAVISLETLEEVLEDFSNEVDFNVVIQTPTTTAKTTAVTITEDVMEAMIANKIPSLKINMAEASILLDFAMIKNLNQKATGDITFHVQYSDISMSKEWDYFVETRPICDLALIDETGTSLSRFGTGTIEVSIPYLLRMNENAEKLAIYYIAENGTYTKMQDITYDIEAKAIVFDANYFSVFAVGYEEMRNIPEEPQMEIEPEPAEIEAEIEQVFVIEEEMEINIIQPFLDIEEHWAKETIELCSEQGLFTGTTETTFSPDMSMTRGMFVTVLGRLSNIDYHAYENERFEDVDHTMYYAPYIAWAKESGIINGVSETEFAPDENVTREQMAVLFSNYLNFINFIAPERYEKIDFDDIEDMSSYAVASIEEMQKAGIIFGYEDNTFDPKALVTRAEVSAMIQRIVNILK